MIDELTIVTGLDQPLAVDNHWALNRIEEYIQQSIEEKNVYIALNVCKQLREVSQVAGLALAKMLYLIKHNWSSFNSEESFDEIAYEYIGLHSHTVDRYVKVWSMFADEQAPQELQSRNIKELIPIANAIAQDYEITEDQWERLVEAPDFSTVSRIVREDIKGADPRKNALQLFYDEYGDITALRDGKVYPVGHLNVLTDEYVVERAIERITKNSGILRR